MKNKMILRDSFTHLKQAYRDWRTKNGITDAASDMPASFPVPESFVRNETWNKFRAQFLAEWINGDAAAYREIAGDRAYIAVDYLDANEAEQFRRNSLRLALKLRIKELRNRE